MQGSLIVSRWRAVCARIDGLAQAAAMTPERDVYSVKKRLGPLMLDCFSEIERIATDIKPALAQDRAEAILKTIEDCRNIFRHASGDSDTAAAGIPLLITLKTELSFALSDHQETIRSLTERSFLHLRRVLAANPREREVWGDAFKAGEVRCEKLGAAHLLWHGIFAFKADAEGGRTDLVFGEPVRVGEVAPAVEGLVLTEWKVATAKNAAEKFAEARRQAELYAQGPLAEIELAGFRYLVVVTEKALASERLPADESAGPVVYRHINIVIDPDAPSRQARRS